jgi:DNA (cytosine-5)-methyltransferase 3A
MENPEKTESQQNGINVLSLFDGMSCGQIALDKCGIKINKYFASEIDKHAIKVTLANYPETIQLGSVVGVNPDDLPKIDLLIGGSPCQSFSFAGKRKGMATIDERDVLTLDDYLQLKSDGFEFHGQSYLFWEYMRILTAKKPKYFLLENVLMEEKWERILTRAIGVHPIEINSALVSAQNRRRLYWTNIGMEPNGLFGDLESIIKQPKDKKILLKHILQPDNEVDEKYYLKPETINKYLENTEKQKLKGNGFNFEPSFGDDKSKCVTTKFGGRMDDTFVICHNTQPRSGDLSKGGTGPLLRTDGKSYCLDTKQTNAIEITGCAVRGRNDSENKRLGCFEKRTDFKANALTLSENNSMAFISVQKDAELSLNENQLKKFDLSIDNTKIYCLTMAHSRMGSSSEYIASVSKISSLTNVVRRLTPIECERLQTIPHNYTNHVSDTQRFRMLGNGWTADVIAHIFSYMKF